jgi:type IV secretory pathway TrbD component
MSLRALRGGNNVEILIVIGILAAWIVLQVWVLPRFGVKT